MFRDITLFLCLLLFFFFFYHPPTTDIYTLSLHAALPISDVAAVSRASISINSSSRAIRNGARRIARAMLTRSEEHTSELQSRFDLVCRLLLEKKKTKKLTKTITVTRNMQYKQNHR